MKQSFSVENLLLIYYYENRKGRYLDKLISDKLHKLSHELLEINKQIKEEKKKKNNENVPKLYEIKKNILEKKDKILKSELENISDNIKNQKFEFVFQEFERNRKVIYTINEIPETFFVLKKLQYNIKTSFKVKPANRYEITNQVKNLLDNNFPKYIIRTDIKSFYESIPHDKLKNKIYKNEILSSFSKKLINKILNNFQKHTESSRGIPRGIGVSAYLSEIYMQDIDNKIKALPNVTYYARYVDDIFIIFTPYHSNEEIDYLAKIKNIIEYEGLELNEEKTKEFDLRTPVKHERENDFVLYSMDFLGYRYYFSNAKKKNLVIGLTHKKKRKYFKKIKLAFKDYTKNSKYNEKKARKLLVKRIRYLTENTRLLNAKKYIMIGIYFSNPLLNKLDDLKCLDWYLSKKIDDIQCYSKLLKENGGHIELDKLKTRLRRFSFEKGFKEKRYCKFTRDQFNETIKLWKDI